MSTDIAVDLGPVTIDPVAPLAGQTWFNTVTKTRKLFDGINVCILAGSTYVTNATFQTMAAANYPDNFLVFVYDLNGGTVFQHQAGAWKQMTPGVTAIGGAELGYSELTTVQAATNVAVTTANGSFSPTPLTVVFTPDGVRPIVVEAEIPQFYSSGGATVNPTFAVYEGATLLYQTYLQNVAANLIERISLKRRIPAPTNAAHTYELKWGSGGNFTNNAYTPTAGTVPSAWLRVTYA